MVIPKRREEREEILFLKMSTDTEIRTVKTLEEKIDQSHEKRIESIQALGVMRIGTRTVLRGDGKNLAGTRNNPESQREIRTSEENSLQQSKKKQLCKIAETEHALYSVETNYFLH